MSRVGDSVFLDETSKGESSMSIKDRLESLFILADESVCRIIDEMTWGLGTLLALSGLWFCFG